MKFWIGDYGQVTLAAWWSHWSKFGVLRLDSIGGSFGRTLRFWRVRLFIEWYPAPWRAQIVGYNSVPSPPPPPPARKVLICGFCAGVLRVDGLGQCQGCGAPSAIAYEGSRPRPIEHVRPGQPMRAADQNRLIDAVNRLMGWDALLDTPTPGKTETR